MCKFKEGGLGKKEERGGFFERELIPNARYALDNYSGPPVVILLFQNLSHRQCLSD